MKRLAIVLATTAGLLLGQASGVTSRFSGPVLGFVPGSTATQLLPIRGIPGAARLGDPVSLPNTVTQTYLAPGHSYVLAAQGPADSLALVMLRGAEGIEPNPVLRPIASAMPHADIVAFSRSGAAAAIYSEQRSQVQVVTGLPNSPRLSADFSNIPATDGIRALAISDDAQALLIADASGGVYAVSPNAAPVPVYHASQVSALAFIAQSHEAIVCDPVLGSIAFLQAPASVRQIQPPSGCQPRAAASTADGRTILIACPAQHLIWSVDRTSGSTNVYKVNNSPTIFDRVSTGDTFLMSPPDNGGTYWLFTWHADGLVTSFIGAAHPGAQGSGK